MEWSGRSGRSFTGPGYLLKQGRQILLKQSPDSELSGRSLAQRRRAVCRFLWFVAHKPKSCMELLLKIASSVRGDVAATEALEHFTVAALSDEISAVL